MSSSNSGAVMEHALYFEKQRKQLCLLHSINHLFQERRCIKGDLDLVAKALVCVLPPLPPSPLIALSFLPCIIAQLCIGGCSWTGPRICCLVARWCLDGCSFVSALVCRNTLTRWGGFDLTACLFQAPGARWYNNPHKVGCDLFPPLPVWG